MPYLKVRVTGAQCHEQAHAQEPESGLASGPFVAPRLQHEQSCPHSSAEKTHTARPHDGPGSYTQKVLDAAAIKAGSNAACLLATLHASRLRAEHGSWELKTLTKIKILAKHVFQFCVVQWAQPHGSM